jgi:hypothetical protein
MIVSIDQKKITGVKRSWVKDGAERGKDVVLISSTNEFLLTKGGDITISYLENGANLFGKKTADISDVSLVCTSGN